MIDNASSDGTAEVASALGPRVRYAHEPRLGLSIARNTGLALAGAALVAYIDDDAVADPGWARALLAAFAASHPVGCIGGRVRPIWEAPRPAWLDDGMLALLSMLDYGDQPRRLSPDQHIVGANMAFTRASLQSIGGFPERLGRRGACLLSREEAHVRERLEAIGLPCVYWPAAQVGHLAPIERLSIAWFRRRLFWQGISRALGNVQRKRIGVVGRLGRCAYNGLAAALRDACQLPLLPFRTQEQRRQRSLSRNLEWGNALGYLRY